MALTDTMTPAWLKDRYLVGIDLTDDTGTAYPDVLFTHSIASAIATIEAELDLVLSGLITYTERRDVLDSDGLSFFLQAVDHRPLREVTTLAVKLGDFRGMELPSTWAAALLPLDTAGDLLLGAGIASQSISMDGLSTSTGTTSSATNAGYGARAIQYRKRLTMLLKSIRRKYRTHNILVI